MLSHMRTTIEIADDLMIRAKERARREKKTLRALLEEILREGLAKKAARPRKVDIPDLSVAGGLRPGVDPKRLLDYAYEDRIA